MTAAGVSRRARETMKGHVRFLLLAALVAVAGGTGCSDEDADLDPGGSTISGNVRSASTPGDASVAGIRVEVRGDGSAAGTTDASGEFVITEAPTGEIELVLARGGCEAIRPLDSVSSRSQLDLVDVDFTCADFEFEQVLERFGAILHEEPFSRRDSLETCVRVGRNERIRDVDASTATILDEDDDVGSFDDLFRRDRLEIDGDRDSSGRAASFLASQVRVVETNADDPCDDF